MLYHCITFRRNGIHLDRGGYGLGDTGITDAFLYSKTFYAGHGQLCLERGTLYPASRIGLEAEPDGGVL